MDSFAFVRPKKVPKAKESSKKLHKSDIEHDILKAELQIQRSRWLKWARAYNILTPEDDSAIANSHRVESSLEVVAKYQKAAEEISSQISTRKATSKKNAEDLENLKRITDALRATLDSLKFIHDSELRTGKQIDTMFEKTKSSAIDPASSNLRRSDHSENSEIKKLYEKTSTALLMTLDSSPDENYETTNRIITRFQLWGAGLFNPPFDLDTLLRRDVEIGSNDDENPVFVLGPSAEGDETMEGNSVETGKKFAPDGEIPLRKSILTIFASIMRELSIIEKATRFLPNSQHEFTRCYAINDAIEALGFASGDSDMSISVNNEEKMDTEDLQNHYEILSQLVEELFSLLSPIGTLRHLFRLRLEYQQMNQKNEEEKEKEDYKMHGDVREDAKDKGKGRTPEQQTFVRVHKKHMLPETLTAYKLPWDWDENDSNYIIIKQWIPEELQEELFAHTERIRKDKLITETDTLEYLKGSDQNKAGNRDKEKMYVVRKKKTDTGRPRIFT